MVRVAYFGHNSNESTVRKRVRSFKLANVDVVGVMPHRGPAVETDYPLISLGETQDNNYLGRLKAVQNSFALTPQKYHQLRDIDLIFARNLDMLACAFAFRRRNKLNTPVVYECLDIHNLLVGEGRAARVLRRCEGALLKRCAMLVCSSERYFDEYFAVRHQGTYKTRLLENRMNASDVGTRPENVRKSLTTPLRLGWIGNLRCRRSLDLLKALGHQFAGRIAIEIHGYPARPVFPNFEAEIEAAPGLTYHGPYDSRTDLGRIYGGVDAVWAIDWFEADRNSIWQIPNRIYEGGYFGVPAITLQGTETARKVMSWESGWALDQPVRDTFEALIAQLLEDPSDLLRKSEALSQLDDAHFVETPTDTLELLQEAIA